MAKEKYFDEKELSHFRKSFNMTIGIASPFPWYTLPNTGVFFYLFVFRKICFAIFSSF